MGICRLCLNDVEGAGVSNPSEIINILQKFLPHMNRTLKNIPVICETCSDNVKTAETLLRTKTENEAKITKEIKRLKVAKINLRGFHPNASSDMSVCRICLKLINRPRIFLYNNRKNILRHDSIMNMLKFCSINLNFNFCDWPVMCDNCWGDLQITFAFKKDYLEVERKIRVFCQDFKLPIKDISVNILPSVRNYFEEGYCEIISCLKKEKGTYIDVFSKVKKEDCCYTTSTPVRKVKIECRWPVKTENGGESSGTITPQKTIYFSKADNLKLVQAYYEVTNNEQHFPAGYWAKIAEKWKELRPRKPIPVDRLGCQIQKIFYKNMVPKEKLDSIKKDVEKRQNSICAITETQNSRLDSKTRSGMTKDVENMRKSTSAVAKTQKSRLGSKRGLGIKKGIENKEKSLSAVAETQKFYETRSQLSTAQESDSDDSFVEEVVHSSFTPHVKLEPLSESDVEFNSIETKIEVESDSESLPQLERMDLPPMNFKIENVCSLDVKREAFDQFMRQDEEINVDGDVNKTRRSGRERKSDMFKCSDCNFETRFRSCAERHKISHQKNKKKVYECPRCPYRITNKWLFKRHLRNHEQEDGEIPVLEPFVIPTY